MTDLLTTDEVAEELRSNVSTLAYWRGQGIGPAWAKIGRRVVYRRADIEAFKTERFEAATS